MSDIDFYSNDEDSFEEIDDLEEEAFTTKIISTKENNEEFKIKFKVLTKQDLYNIQALEAQKLGSILGLSIDVVLVLLRFYKWNKEKLLEIYMEDGETLIKRAGLLNYEKDITIHSSAGFMCPICCNDDEDLEYIKLQCGDCFCKNCLKYYLEQKIHEKNIRKLICPGNCGSVIKTDLIKNMLSKESFNKYIYCLNLDFIDDNKHLKLCISDGCENTIECHINTSNLYNQIPIVKCSCGNTMCFSCGEKGDHSPCICKIVKIWKKKCEDDSETSNWISANTKECTKCNSTIEKNGGCNHMTCRKCKHEFCWVCMGPWEIHGQSWFSCNKFDDKSSEIARDSQAESRMALERYLHYYNRYMNHLQSVKFEKELYNKINLKMEEIQKTKQLSWIEVQFLKDAVDKLIQCRITLKWTYAFAYYLEKNNMTMIFEDNQSNLEMAVETLSGYLESQFSVDNLISLKRSILDKTFYVSSRKDKLLSDTAEGLLNNRWVYNVDV